ncbi:hypothetical protein [Streptomyces sp. NPDC087859]|uniref:hypothetical protein n=1 Tax=Streptomyces sp. NPDC087859 TaxID=3365812 RepID=UPI0037F2BECB
MEFLRIPGRGGRLSDRLNRLVVITAVLGIGAGGWGLWLETEEHLDRAASREKITKACDGLVDPDPVLGLDGGTDRARPGSDEDDVMFDLADSDALGTLPQKCVIYRVGEPGTSYNHFQLSVWQTPSDEYAQIVDGWDDPFERWTHEADGTREAATSAAYPLGDGRLGTYYDNAVAVKAVCANEPDHVTSLNAMTIAHYAEDTEVTDADRRTLAALARTAAERLAARTGCTTELPALPAELPTPSKRLTAAASARGTCAWYAAHIEDEGRGRLPDRALATPAGAHAPEESCLLAVADEEVDRIWSGLGDKEIGDRDTPGTPWWLRTESFFGDEAGEVEAEGLGTDQTPLAPGTAGFDDTASVWWASAICAGEPAIHTLTVPYPYERYIRPRLRALFKAYVDDVAARRGCTGVKFPSDLRS